MYLNFPICTMGKEVWLLGFLKSRSWGESPWSEDVVSEDPVRACWALEFKTLGEVGWLADEVGELPDWPWAAGEK